MCGIVAVVGERRDQHRFSSMMTSLAARGPDSEGVVQSDWFALGFQRLAIFATRFAQQPVSDSSGDITLAFNGEIYNYEDLASELLLARGVEVHCEAEALLSLYLTAGVDFTARIDGDFAIAICDTRTRECHLFRDPFGVKPLYYAPLAAGRAWAAASEVQAFFHHPNFSTDWDEVALSERRVLGFAAWDRTNFDAIRQVPPGGRVTLRAHDGHAKRPIVIESSNDRSTPESDALDVEHIAEQCAAVLERAVERRIRHSEHLPMVVALSGGIDSTIIACFAAGMFPGKIVSLTIGSALGQDDERIATKVARRLSVPHVFEVVGAESLLAEYPRIVLALGAQGAMYSAYFLGEAMRRRWPKSKVALCGEGADELFLGYWMHLRPASFVRRAIDALATLPAESIEQSTLLPIVADWRSADPERMQGQLNAMFRTHQLANRHLIPFDHGMMAHGIECRVPFLDRNVAGWITKVPEEARTLAETSKILLRFVASDLLRPFGLNRLVLDRQPCALSASTSAARGKMSARLAARIASSSLYRSRLALYASNVEELFWLGAIDSVFLRHRAQIDGMDFDAMEAEIVHAAA